MAVKKTGWMLAAALACALTGAQAQVFKCVDASGKTNFSDRPCAPAQKSSEVRTYAGPSMQTPAPSPAATPGMSAEAAAHEKARAQRREQSDGSHRRVDEATAKITKMRADNADPVKCARARAGMSEIERRAGQEEARRGYPAALDYKLDIDYFNHQQAASLHCGN